MTSSIMLSSPELEASLSTLTPYFSFGGDVQYEYLAEGVDGDPAEYQLDQSMLQLAK